MKAFVCDTGSNELCLPQEQLYYTCNDKGVEEIGEVETYAHKSAVPPSGPLVCKSIRLPIKTGLPRAYAL